MFNSSDIWLLKINHIYKYKKKKQIKVFNWCSIFWTLKMSKKIVSANSIGGFITYS